MRASGLYMEHDRYLAVLERQRRRIEEGVPLVYWDDTTVGAKETHCSWGLCSTDAAAWPNAEDHLWPASFLEEQRVAPKYRVHGQLCPFDNDRNPPGHVRDEGDPMGCFYRCAFFQARVLGPPPDKKRALELYDEHLSAARQEGPSEKAKHAHERERRLRAHDRG